MSKFSVVVLQVGRHIKEAGFEDRVELCIWLDLDVVQPVPYLNARGLGLVVDLVRLHALVLVGKLAADDGEETGVKVDGGGGHGRVVVPVVKVVCVRLDLALLDRVEEDAVREEVLTVPRDLTQRVVEAVHLPHVDVAEGIEADPRQHLHLVELLAAVAR